MADREQARARRQGGGDGVQRLSAEAHIGDVDLDPEALLDDVQREEAGFVLDAGGRHLVAGPPVKAEGDDVHAVGGVVSEGDALRRGVEQGGEVPAQRLLVLRNRPDAAHDRAAVPVLGLHAGPDGLCCRFGQGAIPARVEKSFALHGGELGADPGESVGHRGSSFWWAGSGGVTAPAARSRSAKASSGGPSPAGGHSR